MKNGLLAILLAGLFLFSCFNSVPKPAEMPRDQEKSRVGVYSLRDFLDSVRVYEDTDRGLGITARLDGPDDLIEITLDYPCAFEVRRFFDDVVLKIELFRSYQNVITNENSKTYPVLELVVETAENDLTITEKEFWSGKFNPLQKKLIKAAFERKPVKIKGYINGWGYRTNEKNKLFYYINFNLRVVGIQELPVAGK